MAIREPYDSSDIFATSAEARAAGARVTAVPREIFLRSATRPEVREMVQAARILADHEEPELPLSLD